MKYSFCSIAFRTNAAIEDIIPGIASFGYDAIEIWEGHAYIWQDRLDGKGLDHIPALKELLDKSGIACSMVSTYFSFTEGERRWDDSFEMAKTYMTIADLLGAPLVRAFTGATGSREATSAQWQACIAAFTELCPIASDKGVKFALETHPNNLTDTVWGCLRLLEEVDSEAMAVNFQPGSFPGQDPFELYQRFWGRAANMHLDSFSKNEPFLRKLHEHGYGGFAAIEFGAEPLWEFAESEGLCIRKLRAD